MEVLGTIYDNTGKRRSSRLKPVSNTLQSQQLKTTQQPKQTKTRRQASAKVKSTHPKISPIMSQQIHKSQPKLLPYRRVRSLDVINNKQEYTNMRKYRSYSPIYPKKASFSLRTTKQPNEILQYRLDIWEYLQTNNDIDYWLNIQKLLARIEEKATGIVCLSNNSTIILNGKPINNFKFAIKIAKVDKSDSDKEIYILQNMLDFVRKGYHNLPIIYKSFKQNKKNMKPTLMDDINTFFNKYANYNIYINELANGDLRKILNLYNDGNSDVSDEILLNAVVQILMSIASLHNIGIRHNDTHFGNFLYHKIKPGGYIKYTIDNESYYLRNLGYLWVIWDFGISTQINGICKCDYFYDYEMLSLFLRKNEGKYNMRFSAMQGKNVVRRLHGNLDFQRELPESIVKLTEVIYNLSIDRKSKIRPDISIDEGNKLLSKFKDPSVRKQVSEMSAACYRIIDNHNNVINEKTFLVEYILKLFSSILLKNVDNINDEDILFHIDLKLEPFILVRNSNGVRSDKDTIEKYKGEKIVILEKYCI